MAARLLALSLMVFPLTASSPLSAEEEEAAAPFLGLVTADRVNLRAGPGGSYEVIHQFSSRAKIQVMGRQGDWCAVPLPDSVPAFVHRDFLRETASGSMEIRGDRVHVRAGPGLGSASYGFLSAGQQVRRWYERGEWTAIQAPGFCRGWIHRSYVTSLETGPEES